MFIKDAVTLRNMVCERYSEMLSDAGARTVFDYLKDERGYVRVDYVGQVPVWTRGGNCFTNWMEFDSEEDALHDYNLIPDVLRHSITLVRIPSGGAVASMHCLP